MTTTGFEDLLEDFEPDTSDAIVGLDTDVRYCACGCGEVLNPNSKWKWKRGHKLAGISVDIPQDPDRPDGQENAPAKPARQRKVSLTKPQQRDIEGQVALVLTFVSMLWAAADPICAEPLAENADKIVEKTLPIICKSPRVVQFMLANGGLLDWVGLAIALKPVFQTVVKHHVFHSIDGASVISIQRQNQNELYPA